ncbi:MAG: SDR family oxidoreductase [Moraxellaceae bacterium]
MTAEKRIFITGAAGYIGHQLGQRLCAEHVVVGADIRPRAAEFPIRQLDVRDPALAYTLRAEGITHVVHLASVLQASPDRARDYDIDVNGTRNVLEACVTAGVRHLTVSSSGAAYGYHADNPPWLDENDALRGNPEFAYSDHKRLVEEMLADYRARHPALAQLVFRPGTVLGADTDNQITALFRRPVLLAIRGSASPFVFIWDQDVVNAMAHGIAQERSGIYNMAGDGALTIDAIAALLGKPVRRVPAWLLQGALAVAQPLGLTRYGPEQVNFLRYRPVLSNRRLKEEFGYQPAKSSEDTFRFFARHALGVPL